MVIGKFVYFTGGLGACQLYVSSGALARRQEGTYYKTRSHTIREVSKD